MLAFAGSSIAEGTYQRTKDDKTIVWNDAPKPGDSAAWDGGRDEDGYASGFGTLTWYTAKSSVYGRYFGNMVRGKLDGPVNVHSKGKTAHAIFISGKRSSRWTNGRAPSAPAIAKRLEAARQRVAKTEKENEPKTEAVTEAKAKAKADTAQHSTEEVKTDERPAEATPRQEVAETRAGENLERSTPGPPPSGYDAAGAPSPKAEAPAEGPSVEKKEIESAPVAGSNDAEAKANVENVQHPAPGAPPKALVGFREAAEEKPAPDQPVSTGQGEDQSEIDDSVRAMMQPPSSLRTLADGESAPASDARLTKEEAIGASDTAARAAGYNLDDYERPRPEYNGAAGTWSLVYDRKLSDETQSGAPFSVAVDDKTKKASIVTGL